MTISDSVCTDIHVLCIQLFFPRTRADNERTDMAARMPTNCRHTGGINYVVYLVNITYFNMYPSYVACALQEYKYI